MSIVDVIVPCYNYGRYLRHCVESVLTQEAVGVRVLIIDDASADDTSTVAVGLAASDSRVLFRHHPTNRGHIATYNEGIEWASGDYVLVLSADDYLLPGALSHSARVMAADPQVGFTSGKALQVSNDYNAEDLPRSSSAAPRWRILNGRSFIQLSGARNLVPTPTAVVRTALQKRVGGYRPELPHTGDMEMWLRLAAEASVGVIDCYQAVYRQHAGNMSLEYHHEGSLPDLRQRRAALECFLGAGRPDVQELRHELFRSLGREAIHAASAALNEGNRGQSDRLVRFALEVCPGIVRSMPWLALTCKRTMPGLWRASRPVLTRLRRLGSPRGGRRHLASTPRPAPDDRHRR